MKSYTFSQPLPPIKLSHLEIVNSLQLLLKSIPRKWPRKWNHMQISVKELESWFKVDGSKIPLRKPWKHYCSKSEIMRWRNNLFRNISIESNMFDQLCELALCRDM